MARSYRSAEDAAPPKIKTEGGRILCSLNRTVKRYAKIRTAAPLKILEMFYPLAIGVRMLTRD